MAELDPALLSAVANSNYKTLAEGPVIDAQGHRNRMNAIFESNIGDIVSSINSTDQSLPQAIASQVEQGGALSQTVVQLSTALTAALEALGRVKAA